MSCTSNNVKGTNGHIILTNNSIRIPDNCHDLSLNNMDTLANKTRIVSNVTEDYRQASNLSLKIYHQI
jgi:hypothetical protein